MKRWTLILTLALLTAALPAGAAPAGKGLLRDLLRRDFLRDRTLPVRRLKEPRTVHRGKALGGQPGVGEIVTARPVPPEAIRKITPLPRKP